MDTRILKNIHALLLNGSWDRMQLAQADALVEAMKVLEAEISPPPPPSAPPTGEPPAQT